MFISKIGYLHTEMGINNQDAGFDNGLLKCVVDGCSEGKHSEVGAKLFAHLMRHRSTIDPVDVYSAVNFLNTMFRDYQSVRDYMLFTILAVEETDEDYIVSVCGDGNIITIRHDGFIEYERLSDGEAPKYYGYNFVDPEHLSLYANGVQFDTFVYPKSKYATVGVATDGLNYIVDSKFKTELDSYLVARKEFSIRRLINREHHLFKDDITIAI